MALYENIPIHKEEVEKSAIIYAIKTYLFFRNDASNGWLQYSTAEEILVGSSPKEAVFAQAAEAALQGAQLPQYNSFKIELAKRAIGKTNPVHRQHRGENPYCGDVVELTLALNETESKIADIKFEGAGYGLCLASAEFMAIAIKGKSITQALLIVKQFHEMVTGHSQFESSLEKLNIMQGVSQYPMRVKCVTLACHTLKVALGSV